MKISLLIFTLLVSLSTCKKSPNSLTRGEQLMFECIDAHGGERYNKAHYLFTFRDKQYTFHNNNDLYEYTVTYDQDGQNIYDFMNNETYVRTVNGKEVELTEKQISSYSQSLNSVIYFATLPHKLLDDAVNKTYKGSAEIKGKSYQVVEVTFNEEGGGKDFEDTYHYWINQNTKTIDYLAYNYAVGKGGVRFRSAYNTRIIGGIIFQDFINYKADIGTPLIDLPKMWEEGKLEELSKIVTENVKSIGRS